MEGCGDEPVWQEERWIRPQQRAGGRWPWHRCATAETGTGTETSSEHPGVGADSLHTMLGCTQPVLWLQAPPVTPWPQCPSPRNT